MPAPLPDLPFVHRLKDGTVRVDVHVLPNAAKTQALGLHDGALRVRLQAQPVDGKANLALQAWLAQTLGIPKSAVKLLRGTTSRHKQLSVAASHAMQADWSALLQED